MIVSRESVERLIVCCTAEDYKETVKEYKDAGYRYIDTADIRLSSPKVLVFEKAVVIPTTEHW